MIIEDQTEIIDYLASPASHGGSPVERLETHTAIVFLAGARAYKLKRAVRYSYLDFSSRELRRTYCQAELRLNRRTAPALYRRVVAVTREPDGSLAIGGKGSAVEWLVEMNRFDQDLLLDRLAARDRLPLELMPPLASAIARLHRVANRRTERGGRAGLQWVIDGNAAGLREFGQPFLDGALYQQMLDTSSRELARRAALLEARRQAGFVRECHGDLHLRNIVLLADVPTPFDGVEFNEDISCIDTFYDVAFLLMDLWHRALPRHAHAVLNQYLADTDDFAGLALLPLFLSCRAAVRAMTSATSAAVQRDKGNASELQLLTRRYLSLAERFLHPPAPSLVAIGGLSGSGKSTLALGVGAVLGPAPGSVVLRSDEIRKRLCGVAPFDRLGPEGYTPSVTERVYGALLERARAVVGAGHGVIVDAVYLAPSERSGVERLAAELSVPFAGLWLEAPESTLIARAEHRTRDASDAGERVIRMQHAQDASAVTWQRVDASGTPDTVRELALAALRPVGVMCN